MQSRTPLALVLALAGSAFGQAVISAHSGVIHLTEGTVELDGKAIQSPAKFGEFVDVKTGQTLATKDGDAEVLLTPGVFVRVAENSSFRMVSNKLDDTRIEMLSGSAMVQVGELLPDNAITVVFHNSDISLSKRGLYRIDSEPARLRVYDGEARVSSGDLTPLTARKGHEVLFNTDKLVASNFDLKETDAFYRWNARRDEYIAEANISAAKSARDQGLGFYNTSAYAPGTGSWMFNPWFGMFTYMPYNGMMYSPFGFGYFSPFMVGYLYTPGSPYYIGGYGNSGRGLASNSNAGITRNGVPTTFGSGSALARNSGGTSTSTSTSSASSGGGISGAMGRASGGSGGGGGGAAHGGGGGGHH